MRNIDLPVFRSCTSALHFAVGELSEQFIQINVYILIRILCMPPCKWHFDIRTTDTYNLSVICGVTDQNGLWMKSKNSIANEF